MSLSTARTVVFSAMLLIFTVLSFFAVGGSKGGDAHVAAGILSVITGPFVGAFARGLQSCCIQASLGIAYYCAPVLVFGIGLQWITIRNGKLAYILKISVWTLGWIVWFAGGLASYMHALN